MILNAESKMVARNRMEHGKLSSLREITTDKYMPGLEGLPKLHF
jgi:hypothetical protein